MDSHIVAPSGRSRYQANGGDSDVPPVGEDRAGQQRAVLAAIEAADQWLATAPLTMAAWRDNRFAELHMDTAQTEGERLAALRAFNQAYARRIGDRIAGVGQLQ